MHLKKVSCFWYNIAVLELLGLGILYVVIAWILLPKVFVSQTVFIVIFILEFIASIYYFYISPFLIHKDTLSKRGLGERKTFYIRTDNFKTAWDKIYILLIIVSTVIILMAWYAQRPFFVKFDWDGLILKFVGYLFSAMLQDLLFFSFILVRLKEIVIVRSEEKKQIIVVLLFSLFFMLFHLPNIPLMGFSVLFALVMGYLFYHYPNVYVTALAHAILGTLLHRVYELHMSIGPFYDLNNQDMKAHLVRHIIPMLSDMLGALW